MTASVPPPPDAPGPRAGPAPWWLGACAAGAALVLAAVQGRDLWFFSDDWNILADYHAGGFLEPFNGHLSAVPAGVYWILFHTVGLESYLPYRLCGLTALVVLAFQVTRLAVERLDVRSITGLWAATLVVAAIMWNSSGQMNLLFPFLMNFSLPIAALVAIWWHLDRRTLRNDAAASVWLCVALATSGLGIMTMVAVGVELALSRAGARRWAILAPGPILWMVWFLANRGANEISTDVTGVAAYSARMLLGATTSLGAGWEPLGVLLLAVGALYFILAGIRWRSMDARTLAALAAPAAFVGLTAVTRLDIVPRIPPDELRYSWAVAAYLVLAVVLAGRSRPMSARPTPELWRLAAAAGASGVLALGLVRLSGDLSTWNTQVSDARPGLSTVLFATEAVGADRIDLDLVIPLSYVPVTTGGYLDAVADVGSPIAGVRASELGGAESNRQVADLLLVEQLPIVLGSDEAARGSCAVVDGEELQIEPGSVVSLDTTGLVGAGPLRIARFGEDAGPELGEVVPGEPATIEVPADSPAVGSIPDLAARWPYRVSLPDGVTAPDCR